MPLLEIKNLSTSFETDLGRLRVVQGVSFSVDHGQTLCIVGESGCGKSVTGFSLMRLLPMPPAIIESGEVLYKGQDLFKISENEMKHLRGNDLAMIFQEPMTSLNPVLSIGQQLLETIHRHQKLTKSEAQTLAITTLKKVGISEAETRMKAYPHQLSGGMKQRIMIAMALCCKPEVLIADEPTTALDVTIQAQILDLLKELQKTEGMAIILITHDLAVVSEVADEVLVMYASQVVEKASVKELFGKAQHPYTQGLLKAIPQLGQRVERLNEIKGQVPQPSQFPKGCHFSERCPHAHGKCFESKPSMVQVSPTHGAACFLLSGEVKA
jgi:peptide/nickel transport system ATP-binding protein